MTRLRALRVTIRPLAHGLKRTLARLPLLLHAYRRASRVDDRASFVTGFITGTVFTLSVVTFVLTIWPEFTIRDNPGTSLDSPIQPSILETVSSSRQPGPNSPAGTISYSYRPNREPARSPAGAISYGSGRGPLSGNTPLTNIAFTLWPKDGENTIIDPGPILAAIWQGKSQRAQRYLDWQRARGRTLAEGDRILLADLLSAMAAHKAGNWELATVRYGRARKNIGPGTKTVKNHVELLYWLSFAMRRYTENDHPNAIENLQFSRPERVSDITAFERDFYRRTAELIAELALKPGNREKTGTRSRRKTNNSATNISSPAPASHRVNGKTAPGEGDNAPTGSLNQSDAAHPAEFSRTAIIPEMIPLPAGRFRMGDIHGGGYKDELPVHEVVIPKSFALGRYEVTNREYAAFLNGRKPSEQKVRRWIKTKANRIEKVAGVYRAAADYARHPVTHVSWFGAVAYTKWLSEKTKRSFRLPTEAEWEYAARSGTESKYWWGNEIGANKANCDGCASQWEGKGTAPVGSFPANGFGLHDVHGNVWEWVQDCGNSTSYRSAPADGSAWKEKACKSRVIRGGGWNFKPWYARSAARFRFLPASRHPSVGFRLVRDL